MKFLATSKVNVQNKLSIPKEVKPWFPAQIGTKVDWFLANDGSIVLMGHVEGGEVKVAKKK